MSVKNTVILYHVSDYSREWSGYFQAGMLLTDVDAK